MRHLSIMALVAAAVILPAGQSYQSTRAGPEVPFYVITKAETPVVTIGPAEPKNTWRFSFLQRAISATSSTSTSLRP